MTNNIHPAFFFNMCVRKIYIERGRERERERGREGETDRQIQTDRQTDQSYTRKNSILPSS